MKYFLRIEVTHTKTGIFLNQRKYTLDILTETGLLGAKPSPFPMEQNLKLSIDSGTLSPDPSSYRRLIGRLLYLTITRPDITFSVNYLSQFLQSPRQPHYDAAIRVLRYLKSTPGKGIFLPSNRSLHISAFSDFDWAACPNTRRSITGYFTILGISPLSWK